LRGQVGYQAIQQIPGVGPLFSSVFVAEIGDVTRFRSPAQLASWAGLTPKHHESDLTVYRGPITKQGSRLVRWPVGGRRSGPAPGEGNQATSRLCPHRRSP